MSDLTVVDIETSSPSPTDDDLAVDPKRAIITLVGYTEMREGNEIKIYRPSTTIEKPRFTGPLGGHNFKFDFRTLHHNSYQLAIDQYAHDSLVMATAAISKVPESYLEQYELKRRELNSKLEKGRGYREAKKHSLKVLAPYYLGVSPFWENPLTTDDEEYAKKDVLYTKELIKFFMHLLEKEGTYGFYMDKLMPWSRMTLQAELDGIRIDLKALAELKAQAEAGVLTSLKKLRAAWSHVEEEWAYKEQEAIKERYKEMAEKAVAKLKPEKTEEKTKAKKDKAIQRYNDNAAKALSKLEPFNYASPAQLLWAFKEVLKYPVTNLEGDETTGASVLELLAKQGKQDIQALLDYRESYKLAHSYFPDYEARQYDGRIHASFNIHGTRTGRLSSSKPNLQNIPPILKKVFIPNPGNMFVTLDLSAIEPVLIAYYTEDETLCRILIDGLDFHGAAAVALFTPVKLLPANTNPQDVKSKYPAIRQAAKQADLSLFYGSGKNRLFTTLTLHSMPIPEKECQKMVYAFRDMFKGAWEFKEMLDAEIKGGNAIENLFGRKYKIADPSKIYMTGFNTLIQGSASDLLLQGTHDCITELAANDIYAAPRLFVHDMVTLECSEKDAEYVFNRLSYHLTKFKLKTKHGLIPLKVEGSYGKGWK